MTLHTETVRTWNAMAGEWVTVTIPVPEQSRPARAARVRTSRPITYVPAKWPEASDASPIPAEWRYTAFAPGGPLADLRTWVKPAAMKTRRVPTVMPADPGRVTETGRR
jgi:hypothetical protein